MIGTWKNIDVSNLRSLHIKKMLFHLHFSSKKTPVFRPKMGQNMVYAKTAHTLYTQF